MLTKISVAIWRHQAPMWNTQQKLILDIDGKLTPWTGRMTHYRNRRAVSLNNTEDLSNQICNRQVYYCFITPVAITLTAIRHITEAYYVCSPVFNHQYRNCLFNSLFRLKAKKHQRSTLVPDFQRNWPLISHHKGPVMRNVFPWHCRHSIMDCFGHMASPGPYVEHTAKTYIRHRWKINTLNRANDTL